MFPALFPLIAQEKMQPKGHRASREGIVATHFKLKRVRVGGASTKHTVGEHIILRTRTWNPTVGHINVLPRIYSKY